MMFGVLSRTRASRPGTSFVAWIQDFLNSKARGGRALLTGLVRWEEALNVCGSSDEPFTIDLLDGRK
jgi:hypothetical protein